MQASPHISSHAVDHNRTPPAPVNRTPSYVDSHKAIGKGEAYDTFYATNPEMRYLWGEEQQVLRRILREFYGERPVHLLDFACGTGRIASFLEHQVDSSSAVDVSDSMLSVARGKLSRTLLLKADLLRESPFPKGSFNLITAFRFFLNAEPELRRAAVSALEPLLADGGYFVFNIHQNRNSVYYALAELYCRARHWPPDTTLAPVECERLLRHLGFKTCRVYSIGLLHLPKLHFSDEARRWVDRLGQRWNALGRLSDSPIFVARKTR